LSAGAAASAPYLASTVATDDGVIRKILGHLRLPMSPEVLRDGVTIAYDITGSPILDSEWEQPTNIEWVQAQCERGPPTTDGIDEPWRGD